MRGSLVQLAFQQPFADVHHGHVHAAQLEAVGGLEAEQAATNHHCVGVGLGGVDHGLGIGDVAVADHTLQVIAGDGQNEGGRAGRDQQTIIVGFGAVVGDYQALGAINLHHFTVEQ